MGIDSPFGWRGRSGGGIVFFELLDGHITQMLAGRKIGKRDLLGVGLPVGGALVGFLGVMVETVGGLLRLVVRTLTEVWHMAHFWVSYGKCTMPGSPMGRSEGLSRCWAG